MVVKKYILFVLFAVVGSAGLFAQRNMSVTAREVEVRSSPSFLGRAVATIEYGDSVRIRSERGSWFEIDIPESRDRGWVHASALERKRIVFGARTDDVATEATSGEIALAGKGFNREVEERYIEETELDFSRIDLMEGYLVSSRAIGDFLSSGGLNLPTEQDE